MKTYVVRSIGWVFNDSTFDYDGPQQIAGTFTNEQEANDYRLYLERIWFTAWLERLGRLEHPVIFEKEGFNWWVEFLQYLVDHHDFNPTMMVAPLSTSLSTGMFPRKPTDDELDEIIRNLRHPFFQVVELPPESRIWYHARLSPDHFQHADLLMDIEGVRNLAFSSLREAFERLHAHELPEFHYEEPEFNRLEGSFAELSYVPNLLSNLVDDCPDLFVKDGALEFNLTIDFESLFQLNGLLKKPFIQLEEIKLGPEHQLSKETLSWQKEEAAEDWSRYDYRSTGSEIHRSVDFLTSNLVSFDAFTEGREIVFRYFEKMGFPVTRQWSQFLRYKEKPLKIYGVITQTEQLGPNTLRAYTILSSHHSPLIEPDHPVAGEGNSLSAAFEDSIGRWMEVHGPKLIDAIKKE